MKITIGKAEMEITGVYGLSEILEALHTEDDDYEMKMWVKHKCLSYDGSDWRNFSGMFFIEMARIAYHKYLKNGIPFAPKNYREAIIPC